MESGYSSDPVQQGDAQSSPCFFIFLHRKTVKSAPEFLIVKNQQILLRRKQNPAL
jgi:hypothetical protein